jgi:nitroreductase
MEHERTGDEAMNEVVEAIGALRTIHGDFEGSKIPEADIEAILDATPRTANASARQGYSIIVIDEEERMDSLFSYRGSHASVFWKNKGNAGKIGQERLLVRLRPQGGKNGRNKQGLGLEQEYPGVLERALRGFALLGP